MNRYWISRVLETVPMLIGVSLLTFIMFQLAPGDPVALVIDPTLVTEEQRAAVRDDLGLNDGLPTQYVRMMTGMLNGDLRSFKSKQPVTEVLRAALPVTLAVTTAGMLMALAFAFPLAMLAARRPGGVIDRILSISMASVIAIPPFVLGVLLIRLFTEHWRLLPSSGIGPPGTVGLTLRHAPTYLLMPAVVIALGPATILARYLRDALTDVLAADYIRTARAKGLSERRVMTRHAVRNALAPVLSLLNTLIPAALGGAVIVETVFGLPGLGKVTTGAALSRDYPVVMAGVMLAATLTLFTNLLIDVTHGAIDPRIRMGER